MPFEQMVERLSALDANLYDFALWTEEKGVQSHYFQPCNRCNNSYSVAKALTMTAVGLLWQQGKLRVTDSLGDIFRNDAWKDVTVEHALTHRIGYGQGHLDIDVEDVSQYPTRDYLNLALSCPRPYAPGTHDQYTDAAFYLLSRVADHVTGERMDELVRRQILVPLDFTELAFSFCPHGYPMGATGLYASAHDLVKLAALYMNHGLWQGRRLLSSDWVALVEERNYELTPMGGSLRGKGGMYGQGIAYSREKGMAFAWHAFDAKGHGGSVQQCLIDMMK